MLSMTGFGRSSCEVGGRRFVVEVRTVNHRFLDLKTRLPWASPELESMVTAAVRRRLDRGAVSLNITDETAGAPPTVRANIEFAHKVHAALCDVARVIGSPPPSLDLVAQQAGVLVVGEPFTSAEELFSGIEPALDAALTALLAARRREGDALASDLGKRLKILAHVAEELERLAGGVPGAAQRRLKERLTRLVGENGSAPLDPQRIAQEVALLADRMDITEELTRLRAHIEQLEALSHESQPVGRKLDFLLQEVSREVNTAGSKSQSVEIARLVVEAKAELEKIREQVQNIE